MLCITAKGRSHGTSILSPLLKIQDLGYVLNVQISDPDCCHYGLLLQQVWHGQVLPTLDEVFVCSNVDDHLSDDDMNYIDT